MRKTAGLLFCLAFASFSFGQKNVTSLNPKHAAALQLFLLSHSQYEFMPETNIDNKTLSYMRKSLGKNLTPYYRIGDFNRDGILDFALVLSKRGNLTKSETSGESIYPLAVVIFNGFRAGNYKTAFTDEIESPLTCFLGMTEEKKRRLFFGIYESDANDIYTPAGKGYIIEHEDEP